MGISYTEDAIEQLEREIEECSYLSNWEIGYKAGLNRGIEIIKEIINVD